MKTINEIRKQLEATVYTQNWNTEITREDFERLFTKTKEKVVFTFNGWDGKSYDGESRTGYVYRLNLEGCEDARFIKVGKNIHMIWEDKMVLEKATGEEHPDVFWFIGVARA